MRFCCSGWKISCPHRKLSRVFVDQEDRTQKNHAFCMVNGVQILESALTEEKDKRTPIIQTESEWKGDLRLVSVMSMAFYTQNLS